GERLAGEVAQWRPAPQAERRLECRDRLTRVPGRELPAALLGEGLEAVRVEGVRRDAELISVIPRQQRSRDAVARGGERLAQPPAVVLRSHYLHLRGLLAITVVALVAMAVAVVILASAGTSAPSRAAVPSTTGPSPAGIRYDGGPDEGTRGLIESPRVPSTR